MHSYLKTEGADFNFDTLINKQSGKSSTGILEATCLVHTRSNGMALYQMATNICGLINSSLGDVLRMFSYKQTAAGIRAIVSYQAHLDGDKGTVTTPWSRLIDHRFHANLAPSHDRVLALAMATFIDKVMPSDDGNGVLNSVWVSGCSAPQKQKGKAIADLALKLQPQHDLTPLSGTTKRLIEEERKTKQQPLKIGPRSSGSRSGEDSDGGSSDQGRDERCKYEALVLSSPSGSR